MTCISLSYCHSLHLKSDFYEKKSSYLLTENLNICFRSFAYSYTDCTEFLTQGITGAEVPFVAVFFFPFDFAKFSKTDFVWNDFNN